MRLMIIAAFLAASCAAAAKPKAPADVAKTPDPLPEFGDGELAAKMLEARAAVDAARLRYVAALEAFERKYKINVAQGDGWDEVDHEGKRCTDINDCHLRLRRVPTPSPAPAAKPPAK